MTLDEILHKMRTTPWNWYYVCDGNDPSSWEKYRVRREELDYIGSDINTMGVPVWWVGVDTYDFSGVDRFVDALLKDYPQRYFVPRIKMDPPLEWLKANPEEVCVYYNGPTTAEEIREMLGTPQHDRNGWDDGKTRNPYPDQRISNQSFSSKKWVEDATKALKAFVEHLENGPYKDQTIGYMPAFGNCGECMWWGDWRNQGDPRKGDFGISHKRNFYDWAVEKYGSEDSLRKAWNMPTLTRENIPMPTPMERWSEGGKNLRQVLLADDQRQVDCNEFHCKSCFDAIEEFGKVIKSVSGKAAGCFYGYFQDETVGYAGHLCIERALSTPYVDFYSSPKGYHYCLAGDPGSSQAPAQSFARKKLWIEENDCRSHLSPDVIRKADNFDDTQTVFWREIYRALTFNQGFWWMDIDGIRDDWYGDKGMVEMFRAQADFYKKWSGIKRENLAEVLFVEDEESCGHMTYISGAQRALRLKLERELRLCGAVVDHLRVADMLEYDMSKYKFIVFCHAFVMPKEKWERIRARINPQAYVLFSYAAGILSPAFDTENQKAVTGFKTFETPQRMHHKDVYRHIYWHETRAIPQDYPLLSIVKEDGQDVLQTSPDGYVLTASVKRDGGKNIFASDFTLRTELLRELLSEAGVKFLAPTHCGVLADEKLIGFFPRYDTSITHTFDGEWQNVITGERLSGKVTLPIRAKRFMIFEKI